MRRSLAGPLMRALAALYLGAAVVFPAPLWAQDAVAMRVNGATPVIDGRLEDAAWQVAPPVTQFLQRNPDEGQAPTEDSEVRFAYDDHGLYVAFRGYDREPELVYGRLARRDSRISADGFSLFLDSYHDKRTAFEFTINPAGSRRDVFIYDDGAGRDDSWDPVFDWATATDSLGWTVEMRIPFSQLRFPGRDSLVFGLRVRRHINRRNEESYWPFVPRDQAGEVSRFGQLVGITQVPTPKRLELLPYTAGSAQFEAAEVGNPFATGRSTRARFGADLKLGVTSGLTLDLTTNPDFGQVEADAAVVNLTAFESFFPEKRPFFVEGSNLFQFGLQPSERNEFGMGGGGGPGGQEGLVYTRRIGRTPQVSPDTPEGGYAESVAETTILSAAKLSGQIGRGWSVGVMQAVTGKEYADVADSFGIDLDAASPIEPLTSYSVVRAQRSLYQGRLAYGVTGTGTVRRLDEAGFRERLHEQAFAGGLDLSGRFGGDTYEYAFAIAGTRVEGSPEAIANTQLKSGRYFQRPDQDHSTLDSGRTSLDGFGGYARIAKTVGFLTWDLRAGTRSPGFESNDLGYLRSADQHTQRAEIELRWLTPGRVFRTFNWNVQQRSEFTYGWERTATSIETRVSGEFLNYWNVNANVQRTLAALETGLLRGGPAVRLPGSWELRLGGRSDFRRPWWVRGGLGRTTEDGIEGGRWSGSLGVNWRPPGAFSVGLDSRTSWGKTDHQYVTQRTPADSTYYVLGYLDRREVSLTLRADMALTPRLSIEFYAQPFVSAGRYESLSLAAAPRADDYADRFDPLGADRMLRPGGESSVQVDVDWDGVVDFEFSEPDFRVVSLRTNAVLRWEFRPGSTLFVVWQQSRRDRISQGAFAADAFGDAFRVPGTNTLAVKLSYWFGL